MKGIERILGEAPKRKLPITPKLLELFHQCLDLSDIFNVVLFAACVVAFYTFFRKSTLLSPSLDQHEPNKHLCRGDVSFSEHGIVINVRHTKTIQHHERVLQVPLVPNSGVLCPVRAVCNMWEKTAKLGRNLPLFSYRVNGQLRCLDRSTFVDRVRQLVEECGLIPRDYSGHSFRRGGCTWAWQQGVSPQLIMSQGDWKSFS